MDSRKPHAGILQDLCQSPTPANPGLSWRIEGQRAVCTVENGSFRMDVKVACDPSPHYWGGGGRLSVSVLIQYQSVPVWREAENEEVVLKVSGGKACPDRVSRVLEGVWPVVQPEEDAQQAQADAQPQPAHGGVPAVPQEVHQERLPQSAHGERPRGDGKLNHLWEHQGDSRMKLGFMSQ